MLPVVSPANTAASPIPSLFKLATAAIFARDTDGQLNSVFYSVFLQPSAEYTTCTFERDTALKCLTEMPPSERAAFPKGHGFFGALHEYEQAVTSGLEHLSHMSPAELAALPLYPDSNETYLLTVIDAKYDAVLKGDSQKVNYLFDLIQLRTQIKNHPQLKNTIELHLEKKIQALSAKKAFTKLDLRARNFSHMDLSGLNLA